MIRFVTRLLLINVFLLIMPLSFSIGQDTWTEPTIQDANRLMSEQKYQEAANVLEALTRDHPTDGYAWLQLGLCHHTMKDFKKALSAYKKAEALHYQPPTTRYNIACAYALQGDRDAAFEWLNKAIETGFANVQLLQTDRDLLSIRKDDRFNAIVLAADKIARPCDYVPENSQFDFWVGEWDVLTPQGQLAGHSLVEKIINGCGLFEQWSSQYGYDGKSINFYDPGAKKWYQTWISGSGGIIRYEGTFTDGAMRMHGTSVGPDGTTELSRMTLTPIDGGRVHQFIERSTDNGATWTVYFDGIYVPYAPQPAVSGQP